ncbi:MAG: methionyl-tRNA formyltransferase [Candidatus Saccharibacteria bacterium]|nr:methionyl-tRNA formyltransferase [Candidatus Saccharibacteria bacterium]
MNKKSSLVFLGNEIFSSESHYNQAPILQALIDNQYPLEAVIVKKKTTKSRQERIFATLELAKKYNLNLIVLDQVGDLITHIQNLTSPLAIVASFGWIIPSQILNYFPLGIFNLHPSLLPLYRGTTPIETSLLDGVKETGVSLIKLNNDMDAGDIYAQARLKLSEQLSKQELTQKLGQLSANLLIRTLPQIINNQIQPKPQNHQLATYTKPIKPAVINDLRTKPAQFWQRYIQAYLHCSNNRFKFKNLIIEPLEVGILPMNKDKDIYYNKDQKALCLATQEGFLAIYKLKPANRKTLTACEFVNGFCQELLPNYSTAE